MPRKKSIQSTDPPRRSFREADHPPVEINLYRRTAVGFGVVVTLLLVFVSFLVAGSATITVYAEDVTLPVEMRMRIQTSTLADNEIMGNIAETIVRASQEGARAVEGVLIPAEAHGVVVLFNNQSRPQTLIPTTRLLSESGVLFRLRDRTTIPARGQREAAVYADLKGAGGNIGPTHFTIPGLREELQTLVYAESVGSMNGGEIATSAITLEDIETSYANLKKQLEEQAQGELSIKLGLESGDQHLFMQSEVLEQSTNGKAGETGAYTVSMSLHVIGAAVSNADFFSKVRKNVLDLLPSHRELGQISFSDITARIDTYTAENNEADLKLSLKARTRLVASAPELAKKHFMGLSKDAVGSYLSRLEGAGSHEIKMPFFMTKIPKDESRLKIIVN